MFRIRLWQWPNVIALDAILIALLWQLLFATAFEIRISIASRAVLGFSIWLVYTADRLFDVMHRPVGQLQSTRHLFVKLNYRILWKVWICILIINIFTAFQCLTHQQLKNGLMLLALCLLYTGLNQKLSSSFFPKEFCVAFIYTGGVIVFLIPDSRLWLPSATLALLCLINCLIIGIKERPIDAAMQVRSIAQFNILLATLLLYLGCLLCCYFLEQVWVLPVGISMTTLMLIHLFQKQLSIESFRVLADSALLTGPLIALLFAT